MRLNNSNYLEVEVMLMRDGGLLKNNYSQLLASVVSGRDQALTARRDPGILLHDKATTGKLHGR